MSIAFAVPTTSANRAHYETHAVSIPARSFTGDFYTAMSARDGGLVFALGDVAGKGLDAAVMMAMLQEQLEQLVAERRDPRVADLIAAIHEVASEEMPSNKFATLVVGRFCNEGFVRMVNAGHTPPVILRANGEIETIGSTGPVVGLIRGSAWRVHDASLDPGDALVLYSDGVTEAESPEGHELGVEGVHLALHGREGADSATLVRNVLDAARLHRAGERQVDDTTVMVVRRTM
ncbi:MAG: serine/threonine-protein phosphatase [Acidobacteria bacterium]|nr:serine/threonine-protein phosphatase [Acidobacteriota bacterium]